MVSIITGGVRWVMPVKAMVSRPPWSTGSVWNRNQRDTIAHRDAALHHANPRGVSVEPEGVSFLLAAVRRFMS